MDWPKEEREDKEKKKGLVIELELAWKHIQSCIRPNTKKKNKKKRKVKRKYRLVVKLAWKYMFLGKVNTNKRRKKKQKNKIQKIYIKLEQK